MPIAVVEVGRGDLKFFAFGEFQAFGHECNLLNGMSEASMSLNRSFTDVFIPARRSSQERARRWCGLAVAAPTMPR
jgi:hypothetical protein